jgi:hypothetical protein
MATSHHCIAYSWYVPSSVTMCHSVTVYRVTESRSHRVTVLAFNGECKETYTYYRSFDLAANKMPQTLLIHSNSLEATWFTFVYIAVTELTLSLATQRKFDIKLPVHVWENEQQPFTLFFHVARAWRNAKLRRSFTIQNKKHLLLDKPIDCHGVTKKLGTIYDCPLYGLILSMEFRYFMEG